jgi:O-antigen/teichoic acid export membrane protein
VFQKITFLFSLFRLRPFDISNEGGRSIERYRRVALTTMASVIAKAIALLTGLISVPLTFRYLGAERYGIWMVLVSIIAAMGFADLGIGNGLMNAVSEAYGKDDRPLAKEYVTSAFALMLCIAVILAVAGAVGYPFLPWPKLFNVRSEAVAAEGAKAFLVLYGSFVVNIPLGVITRAQAGLQKGYASQIVSALGNVLSLGAMLVVIWLHASLAWLVFASVFAGIAATLLNGWLLFQQHPWLAPSWHAYRRTSTIKIFKLGLLFFVLQCAFAISYSSDNIVIAQVLGAAAVAAYAVPQKLFAFVSMIVGMGITPLWPAYGEALARGDVNWVRKAFLNSLWLTLGVTIPSCTLLALTGPWILRVTVGKSMNAPMPLLVTLAAWGVVNAVSSVMSVFLNGTGVLKAMTVASVFVSLSNLALSILFTRRLGVMGVCLGSIVTQVLITFPVCFVLIRLLFRRLRKEQMANGLEAPAYLA